MGTLRKESEIILRIFKLQDEIKNLEYEIHYNYREDVGLKEYNNKQLIILKTKLNAYKWVLNE